MTSWTDATDSPDRAVPQEGSGVPPELGRWWRAVVRPDGLQPRVIRHALPGEGALEGWVDQVWSLQWPESVPAEHSAVINHPTVHLTLEGGEPGEIRHGHRLPAALLHGVGRRRFAVDLPTPGFVVGLHLTPGAFRDLTGRPAHLWTDRVVPWAEVWPGWDLARVWAARDPVARAEALREAAEQVIGGASVSPEGRQARALEEMTRTGEPVRSVAELAERSASSMRQVQRICREHLGVSPGWLLRRARVLDAHELLRDTDLGLSEIAQRLGWFDQAHLTRDYTAITGVPPARQRRLWERDRHPEGVPGTGA